MDDVKIALEELKEESDSGALEATEPQIVVAGSKLGWFGVLVGAAAVTALGIAGWYWLNRSHPTREDAQLAVVPLTTYPGNELFPSLSPDGTQVAFTWCQEDQKCHIYIKQVGVEPPSQLTNTAMNDISPAWSPDGRFIAFFRSYLESKRLAVMLIPQRGGSERQLANWDASKISVQIYPPYLAWTPDSKYLAFPYMEGEQIRPALILTSVDTGEKRWLTTLPPTLESDTAPAFSPNGRILAFSRTRGDESDLYLLNLGEGYWPQGKPERVVTGNPVNLSAVWIPDADELLICSGSLNTETLWRMKVLNPGKPVRLGLPSENAFAPSLSRTGKRLAYGVWKYDSNIWRVDLGGPGRTPGRPMQLISSTKHDGQATYSTDGKKIAFVSERTRAAEVWTCDSEGRNPVQLTTFGFGGLQGLSFSPDGQNIAFSGILEGSQEVYVVSAGGGAPLRMTTQRGTNQWPFWSHDGRWLYFKNSPSPGLPQIWRMPAEGGEATQVTHTKGGVDVPQESSDGKFFYFAKGWPFTLTIWKIPVEGG